MTESRDKATIPIIQSPMTGCLLALLKLLAAAVIANFGGSLLGAAAGAFSNALGFFVTIGSGITIFVLVLLLLRRIAPGTWTNQPSIRVSHWSTMIEGLSQKPTEFYKNLEASLAARSVPGLATRYVYAKEGGAGSAKRLYLEVRRGKLVFHICGAPFANGFFVSWWLGETTNIFVTVISLLPFSELAFPWLFRGPTYFEIDTTQMVQALVHRAVLETVDGVTAASGIRGPVELERKPTTRNLFA